MLSNLFFFFLFVFFFFFFFLFFFKQKTAYEMLRSLVGSEMQRPLSVAMIGTMMVGLVISLFVIPLIYWFIYRKHEVKKI